MSHTAVHDRLFKPASIPSWSSQPRRLKHRPATGKVLGSTSITQAACYLVQRSLVVAILLPLCCQQRTVTETLQPPCPGSLPLKTGDGQGRRSSQSTTQPYFCYRSAPGPGLFTYHFSAVCCVAPFEVLTAVGIACKHSISFRALHMEPSALTLLPLHKAATSPGSYQQG